MDYQEIREYWNRRATEQAGTHQATTNDVYLRELEVRAFAEAIRRVVPAGPARIADVGCGDGSSTMQFAGAFPEMTFVGYDYAANMVESARQELQRKPLANVSFSCLDIVHEGLAGTWDVVCTDRCLINIPDEALQFQALRNIHQALRPGGHYLMVENFLEGQEQFNALRCQFGLGEIPVREHNRFFRRSELEPFFAGHFDVCSFANISSLYYLVSRVVYSAICAEQGTAPDYYDAHHRLASKLPFLGDFGPTGMYVLRKR